MDIFDFIFMQAKKLKKLFVVALFLFITTFVIMRLSVLIGAEMVGAVGSDKTKDVIVTTLLKLLGCLFVTMSLSSITMFFSHVCETLFFIRFQTNVMNNLSKKVLNQSISFFIKEMPGTIISKFNKITKNIISLYERFVSFIRLFSTFIITISFISWMNLYLGLFYFCCSIFCVLITMKRRMKIINDIQKESELDGVAVGVLSDAVNNAFSVKSFSNVAFERLYIFKKYKEYLRFFSEAAKRRRAISYKSNIIYDLMTFVFYIAIFYTWYYADLSLANIVFIFSSINILSSSTKEFTYVTMSLYRNFGELKDGLGFLYQTEDVKDVDGAKKIEVSKAEVNFDKVCFAYDGKQEIFHDFSIKIPSHKKIGLVGKSGSGKSSLIKLLSRFYDISGGKITIDGQDISQVTQKSLRENISLIPQEPLLFNRTVLENIKYGKNNATDEEVIEAAKKAYCHDFIMQLPEKYESKVGEKGVMLSGGERQRISIARAILQDAPILILDEATSALDSESEHYIQQALIDLMKKKTVIAIAHRLSTLKEMDEIVVLSKGKIVEQGSQADLMSRKGIFYDFYKMQSEGFLKIDEEENI